MDTNGCEIFIVTASGTTFYLALPSANGVSREKFGIEMASAVLSRCL
jgi:hypothetical protein